MENYSIDDFRIEWKLFLPSESEGLSFQFSVLPNENGEGSGSSDVDFSNEMLGILQDTFYVTHLASIGEDESAKSKLDERDDNWDIFRWVWYNFINFLRNNLHEIGVSQTSEKAKAKILSRKKGRGYKQFVEEMGEPFVTRYKFYRYTLLFWSTQYIHEKFGSRTDIICKHQMFMRFWNGVLSFLSESVRYIQEDDVENLKSKFEKILNDPDKEAEYTKFNKEYLKEKGGCFSLTKVDKKDGSRQDVLCFSGLKDYSEDSNIGKAIKKIKEQGGFHDPYVVQVTNKIIYNLW